MIDIELQNKLRVEYNPEGSPLRKAQQRMVEMLKFIDKVCKDNELKYWISFGTLLGAIRHEGFIPWDDDTDICMPVADLAKFKEIMLNNNPSKEFVLQCHETDPNYVRTQWLVLRDLKSEYIQDFQNHNQLKYRGLQVDIFPVEKNVSYGLKRFVDFLQIHFVMIPSFSKKWYYIVFRPFRKTIWKLLNYIVIPLCRLYKKSNNNDSYIVSYGVKIPYNFVGVESDIIPFVRVPFESGFFNAPKEYDKYLTNLYGDWREIPPHSKIRTHDVEIIFK